MYKIILLEPSSFPTIATFNSDVFAAHFAPFYSPLEFGSLKAFMQSKLKISIVKRERSELAVSLVIRGFETISGIFAQMPKMLKGLNKLQPFYYLSGPGESRTPNLLIRSQMLYPVKLRDLILFNNIRC